MASEGPAGVEFNTRLGTITQTNHWNDSGVITAYEPYVREMRVWADLFSAVEIFTPLTNAPKKGSLCGYHRNNVRYKFVRYNTQVLSWGFLIRFLQLPIVFIKMTAFIWRHDFLLIRSPGHFSFMAHILVFLMRKKSITKFAGFFGHFDGERIPSVLERFFMRHFLGRRNVVLIYGKSSRSNFISFFPLLLSLSEMKQLDALELSRPSNDVFRFYSLGRLTKVKGFDLALRGLGEFFKQRPDLAWRYHLIGDGPELDNLTALGESLGIANRIAFEGKRPYLEAMQMIKAADAVIMPGVMEGWPKVVVEAWVAGTIPVSAKAGLLTRLIQDGENGFLFEPDPKSLADGCITVISLSKEEREQVVRKGKAAAIQLSADSFKQGIQDLCKQQFALT